MSTKLLKVLNPILFLAFLGVAVSIALYKIPGKFHYNELLGIIHANAGMVFLILAILHLILNWKWIKSQIFGIKPGKKG